MERVTDMQAWMRDIQRRILQLERRRTSPIGAMPAPGEVIVGSLANLPLARNPEFRTGPQLWVQTDEDLPPSGGADEVEIGDTPPTSEFTELWIDTNPGP